jgi:hypothetical protein
MMTPTEQDQVRQHGRAAVHPVLHVVPLPDPPSTAREATTPVSMVERAPQRGWNRPCAGAHLDHLPVRIVPHHHAARIARQAPGRFRGNADPPFQGCLARLRRVLRNCRVHVNHYLVPLARRTGIQLVMQRRLGQQDQRVSLLLRPRRGL